MPFIPVVSAFPGMAARSACASSFSRLAQRSLTLRPAHSRCHQNLWPAIRRLQSFRFLRDCSGCFRLEQFAGWGFHPLEKRRLCTAHAIKRPSKNRSIAAVQFKTRSKPAIYLRLLCISAHQAVVLPTAGPRFSGSSDAPPPADNRLVVMRDFFASAVVQRMRPSRKPKIANCIAALHIRVR